MYLATIVLLVISSKVWAGLVILCIIFLLGFSIIRTGVHTSLPAVHQHDVPQPAEVIEYLDTTPQENVTALPERVYRVEIKESEDLPNHLVFCCSFELCPELALGEKLYGVKGIALPYQAKSAPPEFYEPSVREFELQKLMDSSWQDVLPEVKKVITNHFDHKVSFVGLTESYFDLPSDLPNNINV